MHETLKAVANALANCNNANDLRELSVNMLREMYSAHIEVHDTNAVSELKEILETAIYEIDIENEREIKEINSK